MKNREFIVIILCICLFWGIWLYLQNPTWNVVATDDFERNLWCASLTVEYEKFLKEKYDFEKDWYSQTISNVNVFYSKAIKDCVVSYYNNFVYPDKTRRTTYNIDNYFTKYTLFFCDWSVDNDCDQKRDNGIETLQPWYNTWYNTEYFYIEQ
jgi:hypothetical protein